MIRSIVGRLIEVGKRKLSLDELENALQRNRQLPFNKIAWPQGLYFSKVEYPYLSVPTKSAFAKMLQDGLENKWKTV
jgi:tRNA pseudouridine38-40 synthase